MSWNYPKDSDFYLKKVGMQSSENPSKSFRDKNEEDKTTKIERNQKNHPFQIDSTENQYGEKLFDRLSFKTRKSLNPDILTSVGQSQGSKDIGAVHNGKDSQLHSNLLDSKFNNMKNRRATNFWSRNHPSDQPIDSKLNSKTASNTDSIFKKFIKKPNENFEPKAPSNLSENDPNKNSPQALEPLIPLDKIDGPSQRKYFLSLNNVFNMTLKASLSLMSTGIAKLIWVIPYAGPALLQDSDFLIEGYQDDGNNILGRHIVQVLPLSSARMNPQGDCFCINKISSHPSILSKFFNMGNASKNPAKYTEIYIPILLNGTDANTISYNYISLEDGIERNITQKINKRFVKNIERYKKPEGWVLSKFLLNVNKPGMYKLMSVQDSSGNLFKIINDEASNIINGRVIVVECPNGRLEWNKFSREHNKDTQKISSVKNNEIHICARDEEIRNKDEDFLDENTSLESNKDNLLEVVASGFEPLELMIIRSFNGREEVLSLDGIQPRKIDGVEDKPTKDEGWSQFKTNTLRYNIAESFISPGEYAYRLMHVRDACNHTRALYGTCNQNDGSFNCESPESAISNGKLLRIKVWARPRVKWTGSSASGITFKISHDKTRSDPIKLPFLVSGDGPWVLEYKISFFDSTIQNQKYSNSPSQIGFETKRITVEGNGNGFIEARKAGIYQLISISDSRCLGGKIDTSGITVLDTKPPQVSIISNAISSDQCIGEIGARIELSLVGEAPFTVYYRERMGSNISEKKISIPVNKHTLSLTPELAGVYFFEFYRVDDSNYPSGVKINDVVRQTVHPQPSVRVLGSDLMRSCLGQSVTIDIQLLGNGPWELIYSISRADGVKSTLTKVSTNETSSINIGPFELPGLHTVDLVEVSDSRRCRRKLNTRTSIMVREFGPSAEFICLQNGVKTLEGKDSFLPIKVSGDAPIDINYVWHGNMSNILRHHISKSDMMGNSHQINLRTDKLGTYELLSVYDYCSGTIGMNSRCSVSVEPKPRVWFVPSKLSSVEVPSMSSVCMTNSISTTIAEIKLEGRGPWKVSYMIQLWGGMEETGNPDKVSFHDSVVVGQGPSSIKLNSTSPGLYKYTLLQISDQLYEKMQDVENENLRPISIKQIVYPIPVGELVLYSPKGDVISRNGSTNHEVGIMGSNFKPGPVQLCIPRGSPLSSDSQWKKLYSEHAPKIKIHIKNRVGMKPPFNAWVKLSATNSPTKLIEIPNINPVEGGLDLDLSDSLIAQTGRFKLQLHKIMDSNGCTYSNSQLESKSIDAGVEIEYVEAPNIVPSNQHTNTNSNPLNGFGMDLEPIVIDKIEKNLNSNGLDTKAMNVCKGDILAFDIIGYQSWSVHYDYNGRIRKKRQNKSLVFKKLMDSSGTFSITKVCHEIENSCCGNVKDLNYIVHNLPSVKVSNGKSVHQNIRQGEKVEILIEFSGTPPFTFTWQRKSLVDSLPDTNDIGGSKRIVTGKILETHTVQNLMENSYNLLTSSEGVFQVTYIQDKYCHYPKSGQKSMQ
ncbi:Nucleoporin [Smittium mucronatum]|uniref:Nucleoporin n=1 Tax=Smittium mucronatum TaxID=133383 RepID=A0A1R0H1C6_9FUNG|nr:Nucleoporin [Smittium mucronatum]